MTEIRKIEIENIEANRDRVDRDDPWKVRGLAADIAEQGLLQPIKVQSSERVVSRKNRRRIVPCWMIIEGHHRLAACKSLGWTEIDAEVTRFVPKPIPTAEEALKDRRTLAHQDVSRMIYDATHNLECLPNFIKIAIEIEAWKEIAHHWRDTATRHPSMRDWIVAKQPCGLGSSIERIRKILTALEKDSAGLQAFEAQLSKESGQ